MLDLLLAAAAASAQPLPKPLSPLSFLVGHCWRGEFSRTGQQDTHCFEPVYGGAHVRDRHAVTGKPEVYRGESLYSWNPEKKTIEYVYWNSAGGVSRGALRAEAGRLLFDGEEHLRADGSRVTYSTYWRRLGDDSYEVVTNSADSPTGETVITYRKVPGKIAAHLPGDP